MNDAMEMQWGRKILEEIAAEEGSDSNPEWHSFQQFVSRLSNNVYALAACFSTQGDILSQWRAYASDGAGFCIGFNEALPKCMPVAGVSVEYGSTKQREEIMAMARDVLASEALGEDLADEVFELLLNLVGYKNPAFIEESEVRLVHLVARNAQTNVVSTIGGIVDGKEIPGEQIQFQMRNSTPSPYIDFSWQSASTAISEVILGPKNYSEQTRIREFLATMGLADVHVRKSIASYR